MAGVRGGCSRGRFYLTIAVQADVQSFGVWLPRYRQGAAYDAKLVPVGRGGRFDRLPPTESLFFCWPKRKVTQRKWPDNARSIVLG